ENPTGTKDRPLGGSPRRRSAVELYRDVSAPTVRNRAARESSIQVAQRRPAVLGERSAIPVGIAGKLGRGKVTEIGSRNPRTAVAAQLELADRAAGRGLCRV